MPIAAVYFLIVVCGFALPAAFPAKYQIAISWVAAAACALAFVTLLVVWPK